MKTCPRCKKPFTDEYPSLSRLDNHTEICSGCGQEEALIDFCNDRKMGLPAEVTARQEAFLEYVSKQIHFSYTTLDGRFTVYEEEGFFYVSDNSTCFTHDLPTSVDFPGSQYEVYNHLIRWLETDRADVLKSLHLEEPDVELFSNALTRVLSEPKLAHIAWQLLDDKSSRHLDQLVRFDVDDILDMYESDK